MTPSGSSRSSNSRWIVALLLLATWASDGALPLWEPPAADYFLSNIPRLENVSSEQFAELASAGQPAIIADFTRDWDALLGWNCDRFAQGFPRARMRAEYSEDESKPVLLGDTEWRTRPRRVCRSMRAPASEAHAPRHAPYIWHAKQHPAELHALQPLLRRPYFVDNDADWEYLRETVEFWLGPPGAGALAHVDGYCESLFSVQLSGRKRWRLQWMPSKPSVFDRFDEFDGGIYRSKRWAPAYEFIVLEGEAVFLPPGWFHETLALPEGDGGSNACHASMSYRVARPPAKLTRSFLPRLLLSQEAAGCSWL